MLGFTALSRSFPARSTSSAPVPAGQPGSGLVRRSLEVHRSVVPGEHWAEEVLAGVPGERVLFAVVRQGGGELLELTSLLLDEEGFGTMRFRLVAAAGQVVEELRGLSRGGAALVLAHDGGRGAVAVAAALGDCADRVERVESWCRAEERWGFSGEAVEEQAWRRTLVEEFAGGRSAAGLALLDLGEADIVALRRSRTRRVSADVSGVSAACGWFRTLARR